MLLVCFVLYIHVLKGFHAIQCKIPVCMNILKTMRFAMFPENNQFRNDGDAKPEFSNFYVAASALGPISSCRASQPNGK